MPSVNLIPMNLRLQRLQRKRRRIWTIAVVVSWVLAIAAVGNEIHSRYTLAQSREKYNNELAKLKDAERKRDESFARLKELDQEIARAQRLQYKRQWTAMFNELSKSLPENVWLVSIYTEPIRPNISALRTQKIGTDVNGTALDDAIQVSYKGLIGRNGPRQIILEGQTLVFEEIYTLIGNLNRLRIFDGAEMLSSKNETMDDLSLTRFVVACEW
ncbi:MAG: hypothetical protein HJJLKODD_00505 [Phycisphaerae bacterium]|nr:hypothetical protein [Phycisphaerae bacterium]